MTMSMRVWRLLRATLKVGLLVFAGYLLSFLSIVFGNKGVGMKPIQVDTTIPAEPTWRDRVADRLLAWLDTAESGAGGTDA